MQRSHASGEDFAIAIDSLVGNGVQGDPGAKHQVLEAPLPIEAGAPHREESAKTPPCPKPAHGAEDASCLRCQLRGMFQRVRLGRDAGKEGAGSALECAQRAGHGIARGADRVRAMLAIEQCRFVVPNDRAARGGDQQVPRD